MREVGPTARALSVILSILLSVPACAAPAARRQLETLSGGRLPSAVFDGSRLRAASDSWLPDAKDVLSRGTQAPDGQPILPFTFNLTDGGRVTAPSAGLEGFLWEERELVRTKGKDAVIANLNDYFNYIDALLAPVSWSAEARQAIRAIEAQNPDPGQRYDRLIQFVADYTDKLRRSVAASDASRWARDARIYELFPRAYNLEGKRQAGGFSARETPKFFADFGDGDLQDIKDKGFDTIWVMGIFPIGKRNAYGTAGGSPYAAADHSALNPDLGSKDDMRGFIARAHRLGMRVIIDFIPNHTSMDSVELSQHPDWFIHRPAGAGDPPKGYFDFTDPASGRRLWVRHGGYDSYGSKAFWEDTAQVDYSNPGARQGMARIVADWVAQTGVDGFRVDMAYQLTNATFERNWAGEMGGPLPPTDFLADLITRVKAQYPATAFIAEGYDSFDQLSKDGFDLVYSKNNMDRPGGQTGMYDALASKDPGWIREAIRREAFLQWQQGGMSQMTFIGNHDEVSPQRAFGPWMAGAAFLELLMPGAQLFYGSEEIGFDAAVPQEHKPIPFSVPVQVDWSRGDPEVARFYSETFSTQKRLHELLGQTTMEALPPDGYPRWVGYLLWPAEEAQGRPRAVAVLANPTAQSVEVSFTHPKLGSFRKTLPPYGYDLAYF